MVGIRAVCVKQKSYGEKKEYRSGCRLAMRKGNWGAQGEKQYPHETMRTIFAKRRRITFA